MSLLKEIFNYKLDFVQKQKVDLPQVSIENQIKSIRQGKSKFAGKLFRENSRISIIGEIKRSSPSVGQIIEKKINIVEIAKQYEKHNISCISVLTDKKYFDGSSKDLIEIQKNISLPILRKDFIVDEYQIYESKLIGADCILIIMSMLEKNDADRFIKIADELNLDTIIEVHSIDELQMAKSMSSKMIGINNRDLSNFQTDLNTTIRLARETEDSEKILISESGFHSKNDIQKIFQKTGINNFLIGEYLMKSNKLSSHIGSLLN